MREPSEADHAPVPPVPLASVTRGTPVDCVIVGDAPFQPIGVGARPAVGVCARFGVGVGERPGVGVGERPGVGVGERLGVGE